MRFIIFLLIFFLLGCEDAVVNNTNVNEPDDDNNDDNNNNPGWLIPVDQVFDGGPGKDGIPAIENPVFISKEQVTFLNDEDLVILIRDGDEIRVYPHLILDWHEIVNDETTLKKFALTYCPLTGSAIAWNRVVGGQVTTFGVSGLLYNSNLIPYDRNTNSNWSQMLLKDVNGDLKGTQAQTLKLIETNWGTIKNLQNLKVLSLNTGYSRSYGYYPYGDYKTNHNKLLFPVSNMDGRLSAKTRVLGVLTNTESFVFPTSSFSYEFSIYKATIDNKSYTAIGSRRYNFYVVFNSTLGSGTEVNLQVLDYSNFPNIITDDFGNVWNVFGDLVEAKSVNENLRFDRQSFIAYWFAWAAFYQNSIIFQQQNIN